jgi:WhiB family redox-sensing transcriptional regulator
MADWRHQAACLQADAELFFPVGDTQKPGPAQRQADEAKTWCARCEVWSECLQFALSTLQTDGVWGGMTGAELVALRRKNARLRREGRPPETREQRGGFVDAPPIRAILADARQRGWAVRDIAERMGVTHHSAYDTLIGGHETVTQVTADRVTAADFSGPPPSQTTATGQPTAVPC